MILIISTPEKVPLILGNPYMLHRALWRPGLADAKVSHLFCHLGALLVGLSFFFLVWDLFSKGYGGFKV